MTNAGIADDRFVEYLVWLTTRDQEFMATYYDAILPRYFETPELQWLFDKAKTFYSETQGLLEADALDMMLKDTPDNLKLDRRVIMTFFDQAPEPTAAMRNYMFKHAREWFQRRVLYSSIDNAQDMLEEGRVDEAVKLLSITSQNMAKVGETDLGLGLMTDIPAFLEGLQTNYSPDHSNAIPSGLKGLDFTMRGGVRPGELALLMGGPGTGKSQGLCYLSRNAFLNGYNVIYFTLEMSDLLVQQRLWAGLIDMNTTEMEGNLEAASFQIKAKAQELSTKGVGEVVVKSYPSNSASVDDFMAYIDKLSIAGFTPDLLVFDYADLVTANRRFDARRDELAVVYQDLRGMSQMLGVPTWSATQLNREGTEKGFPKLSHVSDSWDKVKIADYVFGYGQSDAMKEHQEMDIIQLKVRNNQAGDPIKTTYNFGQAMFYER